MIPRAKMDWRCGDRVIRLGERTLVMGILNATPDSFSDGGKHDALDAAVARALEMVDQGADLIDIGGESTRPGADPVAAVDEINRVIPVIEALRARSEVPISIDTMKSDVALLALKAGADIINDVSAFEADPDMVGVAADTGAGCVLMHMKGAPRTMQQHPTYDDALAEVVAYLKARLDFAVERGVERERIMVDPGIGFGKTVEHNLDLLRGLPELAALAPVLVGASRKSLIGKLLERADPADRVAGSLGLAAWSILKGAHVLRVHDVIETCDVRTVLDTLYDGEQ